jgi:hypothetical protein
MARAIASASLMVLACLATFAVINFVEEAEHITEDVSVTSGSKEVNVLKNLVQLKSYCLAAWDEARTLMNDHPGKAQALTEFVALYGQEGGGVDHVGKHAMVENIVSEYANIMGGLKAKYGGEEGVGVNMYVLNQLDNSIRSNPHGAIYIKTNYDAFDDGGDNGYKFGHLAALDYKAIGLTERPHMIVKLSIRYPKYLHFKAKIASQEDNADAVAATIFLKSKSYGHYQSFLQREIAKVQRRMKMEFNFVAKAAYGASKKAFKKQYEADRKSFFKQLTVQAPAAVKGAKSSAAKHTWKPPSYAAMVKTAQAEAKKFVENYKKKIGDPTKFVKELVEEAGGVKMFFSTTGATGAQSTMKPKVHFVGEKGDVTGTLRTVPGPHSTFVQHFKIKRALGKVNKIVFEGTGKGMKWNGHKIRIRNGGKDASVQSFKCGKAKSFWLKSGETVECTLDEKAANKVQFEKAQCKGWKTTQDCSGAGTGTKACHEPIPSGTGGHCICDTGKSATVDCMHDVFTCAELCAA